MKKLSYPIIAAVAGLLLASANQVRGGGPDCCSSSCCHDGIVASPKVRAMLNEECLRKCAPPSSVTVTTTDTAFGVSPKVQQARNDRVPAPATASNIETAGYKHTGSDGITASPKVRQSFNERPIVEIAPLK
jgi:hypothetical protein